MPENDADVAASFQAAVIDVLTAKTVQAALHCGVNKVAVSGGVAANSRLRAQLAADCAAKGLQLYYPPSLLCTDNAAMIACRAFYQYSVGDFAGLRLNAVPSLKLGKKGI